MKYAILLMILSILPSAGSEHEAPEPVAAFFDDVLGTWHGEGELLGAVAEFDMTWEKELNGRFVRLTYAIRAERGMEAIAHYRLGDSESLDGIWVDSRGEILELSATATDSRLTTQWRSPTEMGRTVYEITGPGTLEVQDYYHDGSEYRLFGSASYSRIDLDE
jgi:hypothetical protein